MAEYQTGSDTDEYDKPFTRKNEVEIGKEEKKFDRVKSLNIDRIKKDINDIFDDPNQKNNTQRLQIAVIIYLLELTGCRPGSLENDPKVDDPSGRGIANLRVGHITLPKMMTDHIHLHFKTKYHTPYNEQHKVNTKVYELLKKFLGDAETMFDHATTSSSMRCDGIIAKRRVFNHVKYSDFAKYLNQKYGMQPRDFRTHKASTVFETELNKRTNEWTRTNPDADEQNKITELTKIYGEVREEVKELLNHKDIKCSDCYIDPRIIVAWCKRNGLPVEQFNRMEWADRREFEFFVWRNIDE